MQQIAIPANCLAFQLGESSQILSGGILEATPHCVRGGSLVNVSRNTMAVFMGPEHQELMKVPTGIDPK
jgi:isopenicillin N synthase-like dioxygenase